MSLKMIRKMLIYDTTNDPSWIHWIMQLSTFIAYHKSNRVHSAFCYHLFFWFYNP